MPMLDSNGQRNVQAGFPWGAILPAVIGGAAHWWGQRNANEANRDMARDQMDFQRDANQQQMDFQEQMSNTAYQRAFQDMMDAGVNPILSGRYPASTPGGATSSGSTATMVNELSGPVSTAIQIKQMGADLEQTKAMTELLKSDLPERSKSGELYEGKAGTVLKFLEKFGPVLRNFRGR